MLPMLHFKMLCLCFFLISLKAIGQDITIAQRVNTHNLKGKDFILHGKVYYKNKLENNSFAFLGVSFFDSQKKMIKAPIYSEESYRYYKENDWSPYDIHGKINKNAETMIVAFGITGKGNYYLDDMQLFVKEGKDSIEIPLENGSFERDSLANWYIDSKDKNTKSSLSKDMFFSGSHSLFVDNSDSKRANTFGDNADVGKYEEVNGVKLYYEVYGDGEPLLLLNGNNSSMAIFNNQLDVLKKKYKVFCLDSRGQGKSTGDTTKLTYDLMAEDVNLFLEKKHLKNVNILGWSDGGNIALILAMNHPDKVKKMAIMGTVLFNDNSSVLPEVNQIIRKQVKEMEEKGVSKDDMNYRLKILLLTEPHINPDSLQKIKSPTLVMAGEHDVVREKHTKLIAEKISDSQLVIFKNADHEAPQKIPQLFNQTILSFFEK